MNEPPNAIPVRIRLCLKSSGNRRGGCLEKYEGSSRLVSRWTSIRDYWKEEQDNSTGACCVLHRLALILCVRTQISGPVILIKMMFLDVTDNGHGDKVTNAHLSAKEEADLGAADIVLDELLDYIDIFFPRL